MNNPFDPQNKPPEGYNVPPPQPSYPYGYPNIPSGQPPYQGQPPYGGYPNPQPPYPGQSPYSQAGYNGNPPPYNAYPGQQPPYGAYPGYPPPGGYPPAGYGYPSPYGYSGELPPFGYPGVPMNQAAVAKATFWQRVGASIIDILVLSPVACIFVYIDLLVTGSLTNPNTVGSGNFILTLIGAIPTTPYQVFMVATGQTLGDKVVKIRVITAEGSRPGIGVAAIRYAVPLAISLVSTLINSLTAVSSYSYSTGSTAQLIARLGGLGLGLIFSVITIVGYLSMLSDPNKQTLFDKLAGAYVVKTVV